MSSMWEMITEVTSHTSELVNLVILGICILIAGYVGTMVTGFFQDNKDMNQNQRNREFWQERGLYK